jgi:dipeptidyl aminopeptidase/acylaminoacyl peptidase
MNHCETRRAGRPPAGITPCWTALAFSWITIWGGIVDDMAHGQDEAQHGYRTPSAAIQDVLNVPPTPRLSLSPRRDRLLLIDEQRYPPISDLAQPMLPLAGIRVNPLTNGPHRSPRLVGLSLKHLPDGEETRVELPAEGNLGIPRWSPRGNWFAFSRTIEDRIELWVADAEQGTARLVPGLRLNAAYGDEIQWMPDDTTLLVLSVPTDRGQLPEAPLVPGGPVIQETRGNAGPVRTYQDLLKSPHDERLLEHYFTSQLALVHVQNLEVAPIGSPGIFAQVEPSPDNQYLLVSRTQRPFSYLHPISRFPTEIAVWDREGNVVKVLTARPLADQVPIEGVVTGPRGHGWHPHRPATAFWLEALDGGDPRQVAEHRDQLWEWDAPLGDEPREVMKTPQRLVGLDWGMDSELALVTDYERDRRWVKTYAIQWDNSDIAPRVIWDRSILDRYQDPGTPLLRALPNGKRVLWQEGEHIFLAGAGATPEGERPFLDRFHLGTGEAERLFQSGGDHYEIVAALLSDDGPRFITRYESPTDPPNFFIREAGDDSRRAITHFPDPAPQLRKIEKRLVTYERDDGVSLSATLYLPPDYDEGEPLPTILWAYPREFTDPGTAGQVVGSPNRFTSINGISHLFFLLEGYAILDGAAMPVVGDPETANDSYVEQIVSSARAAIEKGVELGVTDPQRVGVGGHSYGAFMAANLLAHSDLFQAGIGRSGAYNRTLTPFGFQSERRTLWEAPDVYVQMSPLLHAHQIQTPLLLIHGAADNNSGTYPMQSERLYQAIHGNGGVARLVLLPHESHGYEARESVEHTLYEMLSWFDRHVKNASDVPPASDSDSTPADDRQSAKRPAAIFLAPPLSPPSVPATLSPLRP